MITEVISWELNPIMHIQTKPSHLCRPLKKSKACQECRSSRHSRPNRSPNNSKHGIKWNNQIAETMQHETHEKDGRLMRWLWKYRYRGSWLSRAMSIEKKTVLQVRRDDQSRYHNLKPPSSLGSGWKEIDSLAPCNYRSFTSLQTLHNTHILKKNIWCPH